MIFSHRNHGADVMYRRHVVGPCPHGCLCGAYVAPTWRVVVFGLAGDGPTVSGPR